jgi:hypothetical protein
MVMSGTTKGQGDKEEKGMKTGYQRISDVWNGIAWGMLIILAGVLILTDNKGWTSGGEGWLYFAIGAGAIFIISFFVRLFGSFGHRERAFGNLAAGVGLAYIGSAFLFGFGDWWPMVFVLIGAAVVVGSIWRRNRSYAQ